MNSPYSQFANQGRYAYIRAGYKGNAKSGVVSAYSLTTAEESHLSDEELIALAESRLATKLAEIKAETPHYDIFQTTIRISAQ